MPCLAIGPLTRFGLTGGQEILWKPAKRVLKAAAASNMDVLVSSASRSMVLGRPRSSQPCSAMTRSAATCSGELQSPTAESQRRTCLCPWGTCESWCVTFKARPGPVLFHFAALFILTVTSQLHFWHELSEASSRKPGAPTVHQELPDLGCLGAGEVYPAESNLKDRYPSLLWPALPGIQPNLQTCNVALTLV